MKDSLHVLRYGGVMQASIRRVDEPGKDIGTSSSEPQFPWIVGLLHWPGCWYIVRRMVLQFDPSTR
jgi:hypothetical protein